MWALGWAAACDPDSDPPGMATPTLDLPPVTVDVPPVDPGTSAPGSTACRPDGFVLATYTDPATSGVLLVDRSGRVRWAWEVDRPAVRVLRARPARDGNGVFVAVGDREIDNGDRGALLRIGKDGAILSQTELRDPHHDFVELPDGRLAWLAYEFSQPSDGATQQFLATDRIYALPEGGVGSGEMLFSTLGDFSFLSTTRTPPEGLDGRSLLGFDDWGHGSSLAYRESDDTLFLMWRWHDALAAIDGDGIRWLWGGDFEGLVGTDSFEHAHFSDLWDDSVLVFDNRRPGALQSRLVEYRFDEATFEKTWEWAGDTYEPGIGDVRRIPGCDSVLASWPSERRILEIDREGAVDWSVTVGSSIDRVEFLEELPF